MQAPALILTTHIADFFTVGRRELRVRLDLPGREYGIPWRKADEMALDLKRRAWAIGAPEFIRLDMPDRTYLLPIDGAKRLVVELIRCARECDEQENAERIALDQALLMRTDAPLGFSSDPKIQDRAALEAGHNRDLRRYVRPPTSIRSKEAFGRPTLLDGRPALHDRLHELAPDARAFLRRVLARSEP